LVVDPGTVLDALSDAVLVVDGDDIARFANPGAEALFGLGAGAILGRSLAELAPFDDRLSALTGRLRRGSATATEHDVVLMLGDRRSLPVDIQASVLGATVGWVVLSLRERAIAQVLGRQRATALAGRSVAGMASALAHEIKNPLSGIRGAAQLLDEDVDRGGRELTHLIIDEVDRIRRLIDRMDGFADGAPASLVAVNIHEVLDHVRHLASAGFAGDARIVARYDPSLPPVLGDRDRLVQIFLNLVKNAAEAVPSRGGEIVLSTAFVGRARWRLGGSGTLALAVGVRDNGAGISEALRDRLFEPFVSDKPGGAGLGLSLVAKLVADLGGAIECESAPRRTLFRVLLPLADTGTDAGAAP